MKLKRIIALCISTIMIFSMVPTVYAASASDEELFYSIRYRGTSFNAMSPAPGAASDTAIAAAWPSSGWSGVANNGYINVAGGVENPRIQSYSAAETNGFQQANVVKLPDYGTTDDTVLLSFIAEYTCNWGDVALYDSTGSIITAFRYGKADNHTFSVEWGHTGWGNPFDFSGKSYSFSVKDARAHIASGTTPIVVMLRNYSDYYTASYYIDGELLTIVTYEGENFVGLSEIHMSRGSGGAYSRISLLKPTVYTMTASTETDSYTLVATAEMMCKDIETMTNGEKLDVPEKRTDSFGKAMEMSWIPVDETIIDHDGNVTPLDDVTTTSIEVYLDWGEGSKFYENAEVTVFPESLNEGDGVVDNGSAYSIVSRIDTSDIKWCLRKSPEGNEVVPGMKTVTQNGISKYTFPALGGAGSSETDGTINARGTVAIKPGSMYYLRFYYNGTELSNGGSNSYNKIYTTSNAYNDENAVDYVSGSATSSITTVANSWNKVEKVFTASENANYLTFVYSWLDAGLIVADVELYEVVEDTGAVETIKKVNMPENITTIGTNTPILPTKTTVEGSLGSTTDATIVWKDAPESYSVGDTVVNGTLTAKFPSTGTFEEDISITVTVLEETFTLADKTSVNGQANADKNLSDFPTAVSDSFTIEMDVTFKSFGDLWIVLKNKGYSLYFGPEQVPVGIDANGGFRPVNGNGEGGRSTNDVTLKTLSKGVTYRLLIKASAESDTYSVFLTSPEGELTVAENYGFRKVADSITSLALLTNNGEGSVTATNIKVNSDSIAQKLVDYTVNIEVEGENKTSYQKTTVYATDVELPYFEGYILKSRTVEDDVITISYEKQSDTTGTWAVRNNVNSATAFNDMKFLGSHDSFTSNMELRAKNCDEGAIAYRDTAGILSGYFATLYELYFYTEGGTEGVEQSDIDAVAALGPMVYAMSRAQSADTLEQLNAGVRFFDVRLSRQSNGDFWTRHGLLSDAFRDVATTIAQFANENPGEIIVLDFQSLYDALYLNPVTGNTLYYGESEGDDNKGAYEDLWKLLEETGVAEFVVGNISLDKTYEELTENGTKSAIVCFSKARGSNCISQFINRYALDADTYKEAATYDEVVAGIDASYPLESDRSFNVIHAYATSSDLIEDPENGALVNNPKFVEEANFERWMMAANVLLMDDVVSEAPMYLELLQKYNRDGFDSKYMNTVNEVTVEGSSTSIPFSTELKVEKADVSSGESIVVNGLVCEPVAQYSVELLQYDKISVQPSEKIEITFPRVSTAEGFIDVLLTQDGEIAAVAAEGEAVTLTTDAMGTFTLATAEAAYVTYTVNYRLDGEVVYRDEGRTYLVGQDAYSFDVSDGFYIKLGDKAYIVKNEAEQRLTVSADSDGKESTVYLSVVNENAVISDTFGNSAGSVSNDNENMLFVGSSGVSNASDTDDDNNVTFTGTSSNVGSPRIPILTFNVPKVGKNQAVKLNVYVGKANHNLSKGATMKLAANTVDFEADETVGYTSADYADLNNLVWADTFFTMDGNSDGNERFGVDEWVSIDVTDFVQACSDSKITFALYAPTAAAYVVDREKAVYGGAYEGKAAYLEITDAYTVSVSGADKVTKMGTAVSDTEEIIVPDGSTVIMYNDAVPAFTDTVQVYKANTPVEIEGNGDICAVALGVETIDGAQVRIGSGVNEYGKIDAESGIRFITTINRSGTLAANEDAVFGAVIKAEDSDKEIDVPTVLWQSDNSVFSTALVNVAESNYNRVYEVTPYVITDGQRFEGKSVSRSIYQVAQGLLETDESIQNYTASETLVRVLNAYVNQVGIRLSLSSTGFTVNTAGEGAYTGNGAFFSVSETEIDDNVYTVTLTPVGEQTEIDMESWNTYIRINNNNSKIKVATELTANDDGSYTLTFDMNSVE